MISILGIAILLVLVTGGITVGALLQCPYNDTRNITAYWAILITQTCALFFLLLEVLKPL